MDTSARQLCDVICGISTLLVAAVVILLLIVGGVEVNPGPPKRENSSSSEEEIEVPESFEFTEPLEENYVFTAPVTPTPMKKGDKHYYHKKYRSNKFCGRRKHVKAHASGNSPVPRCSDSQVSVTESFDVLELSPKFSKVSDKISSEIIPLSGCQGHQNTPLLEPQPKRTTAQSKISPVDPEILLYEEFEIFEQGKSKGEFKKLCKVEGNAILDLGILESALGKISVCKFCSNGGLSFYKTSYVHGLARHYFIICDGCFSAVPFYSLPHHTSLSDPDNKIMFGYNILQVLGGRLVGIGKSGIDFVNNFIGLPSSLANRAFYEAQDILSKVSTEIAKQSCMRAAQQLRETHNTPDSEFLEVTVSYDGAYQKRGGKSGGGFSRYCFASAISVESGKVLNYEIAAIAAKCVWRSNKLSKKNVFL